MAQSYDVIIIGSGPGGYIAAIRAAQLGMKVAVVEREHLAGICSNWGCIPTKALLRTADVMHTATHAKDYGLTLEGSIKPDVKAIVARSRGIAARMNNGVGFLFKKNKVDIIWGEAKITKPGEIVVGKSTKPVVQPQGPVPKNTLGEGTYTAKHIIVATGARPRALPGIEPDGKLIWTYFEAMKPEELPKSLLVMGSGAIGIEFASFYRTMGVDVTVVEIMSQVMPVEDAEISAFAKKQLEKQGIKIHLETKVSKVEKAANSVTATLEKKDGSSEKIIADRMISAVGVVANVEGIGLEAAGVKTDRGFIIIDGYGKTNVPGIYAIGDVAGPPLLAHKAEHEAVICVEKIAGLPNVHPMDKLKIPGCTYCNPQVASVGLTEAKAKEQGRDIRVGRFSFAANGKAVALGEDQGMVKTIFDKKTGELLGAHMVGAEVTELIQGFVVAMNLETTEEDLMHTIFPHPTISESMKESVLDAYGRVLNANDMVIKALALALRDVPDANVSWTESAMVKHKHADVGVAVSIPGGLITPIIRKAEEKSLSTISNEMKDYGKRAKERKLKPEEYQGGTTAVSNMGMMGVKSFSAVINPPHATILAVGAGEQRAVVKNGEIKIANVMTVTLSTDHRCVDGALGAELIGAFKRYIENPMGMLV